MTYQFEPPPTYAEPVVVSEITGRSQFNPIWLKWFLDLAKVISQTSGNSGVPSTSVTVGGTDITLTLQQQASTIIELTGVLTHNINVIFADQVNQWTVHNGTTGNYTVTLKPLSGTGLVIEQSYRGIYYCDGVNIHKSDDPAAA